MFKFNPIPELNPSRREFTYFTFQFIFIVPAAADINVFLKKKMQKFPAQF